ncbi:MAG TPA: bifunctional DNA-formamidopyrimidine glycosylase/DNA-(apurinic or apyrimidinic site) lyase [Patescibacteria group bacterium]
MPELPEVETIKRRLQEVIPGKRIKEILIFKDKSFQGDTSLLVDQTITEITRRAKILTFHLDNGLHLLTHLKMTGQLMYADQDRRVGGGHPTDDWIKELPSKHTRIQYTFEDGTNLFFNDQRIFGWMRVATSDEYQQLISVLGPDINDDELTADYLREKLARRRQPIKIVIMDNAVMSGLGNIYACDTLNSARISPFRPANSLTPEEVERLLQSAKAIINKGIDLGGTTFDGKYVDIHGMAGGYQSQTLTYGREGLPCYNCGAPIKKVKLGGRGTYYCEVCQK